MGYYKKKNMYSLSGFPSFGTIRTKPTTLAKRNRSTKKPQLIRAMRAVVQRVASASVEVSLSLSLSLNFWGSYPTPPAQDSISVVYCSGGGAHRIRNWAGPARSRRTPRVRLRLRCRLHVRFLLLIIHFNSVLYLYFLKFNK